MKKNILISGSDIDILDVYDDIDFLFTIEDKDVLSQCFIEIWQYLITSIFEKDVTLNITLLNITNITKEDFVLLLKLGEHLTIEKITFISDSNHLVKDFAKDLDVLNYKIVNSPLDYISNNPL